MLMMILFRLILAYQIELALACLDAWEFAPAQPRLEPEVDQVAQAHRRQASHFAWNTDELRAIDKAFRLGAAL
jgi:hypothetical protein